VSSLVEKMPTGPTIVLISSCALVGSLLFAPRRGMFWNVTRGRALAWRIRRENLLKDLYGWVERGGAWSDPVSLPAAMGIRGEKNHLFRRTVRWLARAGLVEFSGEQLSLTPAGLVEAERVVRTHRIWEVYLVRRLDLPPDHVHRDAEAMEHALTDDTVREFEKLLGHPTVDPHGRPIPPRRAPDG
jgi:manganese/zinc/iron transport system permease protein